MHLASVFVYPLKSARAAAVDHATVEARGLAGDRRWMVVDPDGAMISQREEPRMAWIDAGLASGGGLALAAVGRDGVEVALPAATCPRRTVTVFGEPVLAADAGPAAAAWLSAVLGRPVALVHMPDDSVRPVDPAHGAPGDRVSFADGYPLLLTLEASLAELVRRIGAPLPMDRFRPNLVIGGDAAPFAEDGWARIQIGAVRFRVVKPCERCVVTTADQRTGERGPEPLRTLATFRRAPAGVLFGQNLIADDGGVVCAGDPLTILA